MPPAEKKFVLTHVFEDVLSLKINELRYSTPEAHFHVPWKLCVIRKKECLGFYLYCDQPATSKWSISIKQEQKTVSFTGKTSSKTSTTILSIISKAWGWNNFIKWEEMEKDYLINGSITVEAHVKILKMTGIQKPVLRCFDESAKEFSDVMLTAENQNFYVSKLYLSSQSSYFAALFLRNFKELGKSQITLTDVKSKDFQNFLELLHAESSIDEDTVEGILKLADMYIVKLAIRKCEDFLINESEKPLSEKLRMAKEYNLEKLKNDCLSQINTAAEIRSVLVQECSEMDKSVVGALLQKALALVP